MSINSHEPSSWWLVRSVNLILAPEYVFGFDGGKPMIGSYSAWNKQAKVSNFSCLFPSLLGGLPIDRLAIIVEGRVINNNMPNNIFQRSLYTLRASSEL